MTQPRVGGQLLSDFSLRAATMSDLQGVTDLVVACDIADFGEAEFNSDELLVDWQRNGFNLGTDAWVVASPDGKTVGYGDVWDDGKLVRLNPNTCVHPDYRGRGIGTCLVQRAEEWARDHLCADGTRERVILNQYIDHANAGARELMASEGHLPVRYHWRMQIDMEAEPPEPELPAGIILRHFLPGKDDHAAHMVIQEAFEDIWGHAYQPFEEWEAFFANRVGFDPGASFLAISGNEIAGATMSFDYSPLGWVRQVAVRRPWRGRGGVALALLHQVFRRFYQRGIRKVGLVVDADSLTGATRLYQRAGMHSIQQFDQIQKELLKY